MRNHAHGPYDEVEALEREERRRKVLRRTLLCAFGLLLSAGMAGARFARNAQWAPAWALATPTPSVAPQVTPSPAPPSQTNAPVVPSDTPAFSPTALIIDGTLAGVLASNEAVEALLYDAVRYFEQSVADVGLPQTSIENDIELRDATAEEAAALSNYDALFAVLTGEETPLRVLTLLSAESFEDVPCETSHETTKYLLKGTHLIVQMGRDGSAHTVRTARYLNGKADGKPETKTAEAVSPVQGIVLNGTQAVDRHAEPGKAEGQKGPDAEALSFVKPLEGGEVALNFGQFRGVMHLGLDYTAAHGTPVLASAAGTVVCVMERGGYGLMVEIDHGGGFVTRYAHLAQAFVSLGQSVAQGETIGMVGATGNADAPMLHFELRVDGIAYNPRFYLA